MQHCFLTCLADDYHNRSQRVRVLSEAWVLSHLHCPACGAKLRKLPNNTPAADFACTCCPELYELKSTQKGSLATLPGGAYESTIKRICSNANPNLLILRYDKRTMTVQEVVAIPRYYFVPEIIRRRNPLSPTARRAGWVGCTLLLGGIPLLGRILLLGNDGCTEAKEVCAAWGRASVIANLPSMSARGWLATILFCIERLGAHEFTLQRIYELEHIAQQRHPSNAHVREKLRQQLQVLRDKGFLLFLGRGRYRLAN